MNVFIQKHSSYYCSRINSTLLAFCSPSYITTLTLSYHANLSPCLPITALTWSQVFIHIRPSTLVLYNTVEYSSELYSRVQLGKYQHYTLSLPTTVVSTLELALVYIEEKNMRGLSINDLLANINFCET